MGYIRVIPRDLFNEASLLKCYGRLYILLEKMNVSARFSSEDVDLFEIEQRDSDGAIFVSNLSLIVGDDTYILTRPLNSRGPWPLYAESENGDDIIGVFDDEGELSPEMKNLLGRDQC